MNDWDEKLSSANRAVLARGPTLGQTSLDQLMPMHIWVGPTGHILHAGPTLEKICAKGDLTGLRVMEVLEFRRPRRVQGMGELMAHGGKPVQVQFRDYPRRILKGLVAVLPDQQGVMLDLSLGISVAELVREYRLTSKDFAASDPTVEMLYLIEAQSVILQESKRLNNRLEGARIAAEEQAFTDTLTGLRNRRALDHIIDRLGEGRQRQRFGLMHLDLDFFKAVNDTHGHAAGDHVLKLAAEVLVAETRKGDIVARVGGDEFVLVLMDCDDVDTLNAIAGRIIRRLELPMVFNTAECRISASIGITVSSFYREFDPVMMAADADAALYASKNRGRACHTFYAPAAVKGGRQGQANLARAPG